MAPVFEEKEDLLPRTAFIALLVIFVVSDAFLLVCTQIQEMNTPIWMFAITTVIFALIIVLVYLIKMRIVVENDVLHISLIKEYSIPFADIIDYKTGDIDIIKNYSGWGLKSVKFKNIVCAGYEQGVTLKLMGRKVFTITTSRPEELVALLPKAAE